jgi:hypothetical protein
MGQLNRMDVVVTLPKCHIQKRTMIVWTKSKLGKETKSLVRWAGLTSDSFYFFNIVFCRSSTLKHTLNNLFIYIYLLFSVCVIIVNFGDPALSVYSFNVMTSRQFAYHPSVTCFM